MQVYNTVSHLLVFKTSVSDTSMNMLLHVASVKPPLGYLLNDAPGSPMSPPRRPMAGGAFIVARRGTVYVTPGPYLAIAKIF